MVRHSEIALITGSSGFTGAALAAQLISKGLRVVGLSREPEAPWEARADITDGPGVRKIIDDVQPDIVFHLAGVSSPAHPTAADIYASNVLGTASLLSALANSMKPPRLVMVASSAAVYAPPSEGQPLSEDALLGPSSHYGVSKLATEGISSVLSNNLRIKTVRPFNYTGPGQSENFLIPKLVGHFARGAEVIELGNTHLFRDISSVDDVIESYTRLAEDDEPGTYNFCSGHAVRLDVVIDILRELSGNDILIKKRADLVRINEPQVLVGCRDKLDQKIGTWKRRTLRDLLSEMYEFAKTES